MLHVLTMLYKINNQLTLSLQVPQFTYLVPVLTRSY